MPHKFSHANALVVHVPPSTDAATTTEQIHSVVSNLMTDAFSGNFNQASFSSTLTHLSQYVECNTRQKDIAYGKWTMETEEDKQDGIDRMEETDWNILCGGTWGTKSLYYRHQLLRVKVRTELGKLSTCRAVVPVGTSPGKQATCARQLCGVLKHLFSQ